jgi:alpha-soluble NSF attachment protein
MSIRGTDEANDFVQKGDKALQGWGIFGNKWEKALEWYTKAINAYKINKNWKEAGDTLKKTIQCHLKLDSRFDAANAHLDAATMYQKVSKKDAITSLNEAISAFLDLGNMSKVGKIEQQLGELFEELGENENLKEAVTHYQRAADYYETDNQRTSANSCTLKAAHLKAIVGEYEEALLDFEKAARNAIDDKLLKYGAKDYFFKAALMALCKMKDPNEEMNEFKERLESYKEDDVNFADTYESKLLDKIVAAIEAKNIKQFQAAVREYDSIKKLDQWKTNILLRVKAVAEQGSIEDLT